MPKFYIAEDTCQFTSTEEAILHSLCDKVKREGMVIAEVGAWLGCSTAVMGKVAKENKGIVYTVDWFRGSGEKTPLKGVADRNDIFNIFRTNMNELGLQDAIKPLVMTSSDAVNIIKDNMFDLIFIDADHVYQAVKQDIEMWLPKLKKNGIICGHDCEEKYDFENKEITAHKDMDFWGGMHCGVVKAVGERFNNQHNIEERIWWIQL